MSMRAGVLTAWTSVVFILATLLLSHAGDAGAALREFAGTSPSTLQLLTMPINRSQPSDLRHGVLPIAFAGLLLISAAIGRPSGPASKSAGRPKKERPLDHSAHPLSAISVWTSYWLELLSLATIVLAVVSALYNDSWLLSRGWILEFAAGCGWAILLSRVIDLRGIKQIFIAGSLVAVCAVLMSFQYRQAHHVEYFAWPIGPVTLTAGMAALWAASALAYLFRLLPHSSRTGASPLAILWAMLVLLAVVAALVVAARRGAWLAVLGASFFMAIVMIWRRCRTRGSKLLLLASAPALSALVILYAVAQSRSADPRSSIPVTFRWAYWKNTVARLADAPLLGRGPDMFICKMSSIIGQQRAEMPRVLHGTIDPEAHNEWLQAAFELGLPGALLYLAIPLVAVAFAVKTWLRGADVNAASARSKSESQIRPDAAMLLACAAGIVAILISESTSVCLRRGGMNVWYWTLIGLIAAWMRQGTSLLRKAFAPSRRGIARLAAIAAAAALCILLAGEAHRRIAHARGCLLLNRDDRLAAESLAEAGWRLGAWQAIGARADLGEAQLAVARTAPKGSAISTSWASKAAETLRELYRIDPAYPGAVCRLAQALQLAGDLPAACDALERYLATVNVFDMPANYLRVVLCPLDPEHTVACVEHALRDGEWMPGVAAKTAAAFESPAISQSWTQRVLTALDAVSRRDTSQWANTVAPETLRLEAVRLAAIGHFPTADRMETTAVDAYARLAQEQSPYRRSSFAEADASLASAKFMFAADPLNPGRALERIKQAESLALDGIVQRAVVHGDPSSERIGGQVLPAEFPARLSPLWRFSALLRLAAGDDPRWVQQRVEWSLPEDRRTGTNVAAELGAIASELVKVYAHYDESRRPRHFADFAALAQRFNPPAAPAVPNR